MTDDSDAASEAAEAENVEVEDAISAAVAEDVDIEPDPDKDYSKESVASRVEEALNRGIMGQGGCRASLKAINENEGADKEHVRNMMEEEAVAAAFHTFMKNLEKRDVKYDDLLNVSVVREVEKVEDSSGEGPGEEVVYTIRGMLPEDHEAAETE